MYANVQDNPGVREVADMVNERVAGQVTLLTGPISFASHSTARWLLWLAIDTFEGESGARLKAEVLDTLISGARPVIVFAPEEIPWDPKVDEGRGFASPFDKIIQSTPQELRAAGLFDPIAIEWRSGMHCAVSLGLVAKALGARVAQDGLSRQSCQGATTKAAELVYARLRQLRLAGRQAWRRPRRGWLQGTLIEKGNGPTEIKVEMALSQKSLRIGPELAAIYA